MARRSSLDKMLRPFALKAIQIVLQSRLGRKIGTRCDPAKSEPFGLAVDDIPDIARTAKGALANESLAEGVRICVEIALKFIEDDEDSGEEGDAAKDGYENSTGLETWCIEVEPSSKKDVGDRCRTAQEAYSALGSTLKSLACVARALPAYRMTRRLDATACKVHYGIRLGGPASANAADLGDTFKTLRFEKLDCGSVAINIGVTYRTELVKSWSRNPKAKTSKKKTPRRTEINLDTPLRPFAFVDAEKAPFGDENIERHYREMPWLFGHANSCAKEFKGVEESPEPKWESRLQPASRQHAPTSEDPFKRPLQFAFATPSALGELANFYRAFNDPPELSAGSEKEEREDNGLREELEVYERNLGDYERLIGGL